MSQTDRQTDVAKLIVVFSNFAKAPNKALRLVVNVVIVVLVEFPASEFYVPTFRNTPFHLHMNMEHNACSGTSAQKTQTPRYHPKE
jgi:hypothetical protein